MGVQPKQSPQQQQYQETSVVFSALSDPTRCAIIVGLAPIPKKDAKGKLRGHTPVEKYVGQICEETDGMSQPAISHHLALLRASRIVASRRSGKNNYYSLTPYGAAVAKAAQLVMGALGGSVPDPAEDAGDDAEE